MSRWKSSFAGSLLVNCLLLAGGAIYLQYAAPEPDAKPEPVEIEIVNDAAAPSSAPQIAAPKPEKVEIPPPPTPEQVQQVKEGIPVDDVIKPPTPTPPTPTPSPVDPNAVPNPQNPNSNPNPAPPGPPNPNPEPDQDLSRRATPAYRVMPNPPNIPADVKVADSVIASWVLDENGNILDVYLEGSFGFAPADEAALEAARQWTWNPALDKNGNPVPSNPGARLYMKL